MARLSGRAAIITGGAKGIGRHYSRALAAEGARVMIADIADGQALAEEIAAEHGANSVMSAVADLSPAQTTATRHRSRKWWPRRWSASARSTCW
jgi:NAD(P)-dependent dehydrogenase (short-subunit alcohol dehydrogenase family)